MEISGLSKDRKVQRYLKSVYGLNVSDFRGLPVFKKDGSYFLGGFKNFYSVLTGESKEEVRSVVRDFFAANNDVSCDFSVSTGYVGKKGALIHYLLDLSSVKFAEDRFGLYGKKTRNQVRKSYNSGLTFSQSGVPEGFYPLYLKNIERLKGLPRDGEYFTRLEYNLGDSVVCFSLFDGGKLVGSNYSIVSGDYMMLLFNVSDSDYWPMNINDRLYDEMISWAIKHDVRYVDFGPGTRGDKSHNHFKEGFGADMRTMVNFRKNGFLKSLGFFLSEKRRNLRLRIMKIKR